MRNSTNGSIISRIVKLETSDEALRDEVRGAISAIQQLGERIDREFARMREAAKPNYAVWISLASLVIGLMVALGSAAYVPVWITTKNINDKAQMALDWQASYQRGQIPSSAEPKIAAMETKFTEVETQFKGAKEELNTQISNNAEINRLQSKEIDLLRERVRSMEKEVAAHAATFESHDKYLFPEVGKNSEHIHDLEKSVYENRGRMQGHADLEGHDKFDENQHKK